MIKFINLTPHALTIEGLGTLPASGVVARVESSYSTWVAQAGMPVRVRAQSFGAVMGLPEAEEGVALIVSALVLGRVKAQWGEHARPDVFAPDTGPDAVRENGQIVAVRGLVC